MTAILRFPFTGHWLARNSPARRVPSHGTWLGGSGYAIDFIGLDARGRTAPHGFASTFMTEENYKFPGFGRAILAPCSGVVVHAHDGEADHVARRSQIHLIGYALGQKRRFEEGGVHAITGNVVTIDAGDGMFVSLVHLQQGTQVVDVGQRVVAGELLGRCGNTGNSTQPHVHVQVTDSPNLLHSNSVELAFLGGGRDEPWIPGENEKFFVD